MYLPQSRRLPADSSLVASVLMAVIFAAVLTLGTIPGFAASTDRSGSVLARTSDKVSNVTHRAAGLDTGHPGYTTPVAARYWRPVTTRRISLLDGQVDFARPVTPQDATVWKAAMHHGHPGNAAELHLWLGEYELSAKSRPGIAIWHFKQAQALSHPSDEVSGAAAYDTAVALYTAGAYQDSMAAFDTLLKHPRSGFDQKDCSLWYRHAAACVGFHEERAKLGIPEPERLDPLAGAAALSTCLRALGLPWSKHTVLAACPDAGDSFLYEDIKNAGKKLGATVQAVIANDEGLMSIPKPLVAEVERDHFVAVVKADRKGVSYLCSDCGPYPGGRVDLSWTQWHALEPAYYLTVTRPNSPARHRLSGMLNRRTPLRQPFKIAARGYLRGLMNVSHALEMFKGAVIQTCCTYPPLPGPCRCGGAGSLECAAGVQCCPMDGAGAGLAGDALAALMGMGPSQHGPSFMDPVNLASGEEEYGPLTDLTVYNPQGPAVSLTRIYNSLRSTTAGHGPSNDFGAGWSTNYNIGVYDPTFGYTGTKYIVEANGARIPFTASTRPTAYNTTVTCTVDAGYPLLVEWDYNGTTAGYYKVTSTNRSTWTTLNPVNATSFSSNGWCPIGQMADRNGNTINFLYDSTSTHLTSITDSASTALLTITRDTNGYVTAVSDRYNRSIYYQASSGFYPELGLVSQVVTTGTSSPPVKYTYAYQSLTTTHSGTLTLLHTITVPSPTGTGNVTATIDYESSYGWVADLVDANGNKRVYTVTDSNHASVAVKNPAGTAVYSYAVGWDNNMSGTTRTDGAGTVVSRNTYADPQDPFRPSTVTDGVGSALNPAVPQGSSGSFAATGTDSPAGGWDIVRNIGGTLTTIATDTSPNGWNVSLTLDNIFTVSAPAGATVATNYEVRSLDADLGVNGRSAYFDVTTPGAARQGTTYYTWDQFGNCTSKTSPRGTATTYTWSYANFTLGELTEVQEGAKSPTSYTYYEPSGLVNTITAPKPGTSGSTLTVQTAYTWTTLGNLATITAPGNNSATSIVTTFGYTTDGTYTQAEALDEPIKITDNNGKVFHRRYDGRGNQTADIDQLSNETDTSYDLSDHLLTITYPATGQSGTGHATSTTSYLYVDGPPTAVTYYNESGTQVRQSTFTFGLEGEMLGGAGMGQPFTHGFDAQYRPVSLEDGNSHTASLSYNTAGYISTVTWPGGQSTQFSQYDADGHVLKRVDGNNVETDYTYDDPGVQLTDIQYPAATPLNAHFSYDSYGRRSQMTDGTGSQTNSYDDLNKLLSVQTTYTGIAAKTISYTYYPDGSRYTMVTPAGTSTYSYDGVGRLSQLVNPYSETSQWSYLDNNWLGTQTLGDGAHSTFTYNARGFLLRLQNLTSTNSTLSDFGQSTGMVYDALGNRTSMPANIPGSTAGSGSTTYSYNSSNELTQEASARNGSYTNAFGYDAAFNPTTWKGVTQTFNSNNQNSSLTYDGNGSPTSYNGSTASFDPEGRLAQLGSLMTAGYTGANLRAWKQNGSSVRTYFLYDGPVPVIEMDSSGNVTAVNTFGAGGLLSRRTGSSSVFYTFDPQGSVAQRLDASQNVSSTSVFDAFGATLAGGVTDPWGSGARSGYYTDTETGLQLLTYRYYDPNAGRFLTRDPLGDGGGINQYAYAFNNPTRHNDPSGLLVPGGGPLSAPFGSGVVGEGSGIATGAAGEGSGAAAGVAAGEAEGVIAGGVAIGSVGVTIEAGSEIYHYDLNSPCQSSGPFTWIGVRIGNMLYHVCDHITPDPPHTPPCGRPTREQCEQALSDAASICEATYEDDLEGLNRCAHIALKRFRRCLRQAEGN